VDLVRGCGTVLVVGIGLTCVGGMVLSAMQQQAGGGSGTTPSTPSAPTPPRVESPLKPLSVTIRNKYAESLFTLDVTVVGKRVDGDSPLVAKKYRVCERARIEGHGSEDFRDLFKMNRAADVKFTFAATSLGETRYFTVTVQADKTHDTLRIDYDWDVATAAFTISYGWH
jgi:hypothetical protein